MAGRAPANADPPGDAEPPGDCRRCVRLSAFRSANRAVEPDWHNAPVGSFGPTDARLLVVGLAPGLKGANRTGRPFTGDYAGELLYATLSAHGFAVGPYGASAADGLVLRDCMITNAVRCVPPRNKPTPDEIARCRPFLAARIAQLPNLRVILALGRIAHDSTLTALGEKRSAHPFGHGVSHEMSGNVELFDSYHCSRYNTNTGRLTAAMFDAVMAAARRSLDRLAG